MADEHDAGGLAGRAEETGRLLVRSGIEIGRTLHAMQAAGDTLSAELASDEHLFNTRLLEIDEADGTISIGWSDSKEANALVMALGSVAFRANHEGLQFRFIADNPREASIGSRSVLQLSMPTAMLAAQRRALPRYKVPATVPLRCEIVLGPMAFDVQVVDVSLSGLGAIVYDPSIRLDPGMTIPRATIFLPPHAPVLAALEVRYIHSVARADGTVIKRAGCRFIAPSTGIEAMVRLFLAAVEATLA